MSDMSYSLFAGHLLGGFCANLLLIYCLLLCISFFDFKKTWRRFKNKTVPIVSAVLLVFTSALNVAGAW